MKIHVLIGRNGQLLSSFPVVEDATRLFCTGRARAKLVAFIVSKDGLCKRCMLACRSDELANGICAPGIGCAADVDGNVFAGISPEAIQENFRGLMSRVWGSFLSSLPRGIGKDDPTLPEVDKNGSNLGTEPW